VKKASINKTEADLKKAEITTVFAIHKMAQSRSNGATVDGKEPNIEENHSQGQTR
jgi:hypothetical protein